VVTDTAAFQDTSQDGRGYDASADPVFEVRDASVSVEGRVLLAPTRLTFGRGRVYGIIGHNGSGKSTLLKLLGRQMAPSFGQISFADRPLDQHGARAFARQVAYLPQITPAATGLTVRELVGFGRYPWHGPLGRMGPEDRAHIKEALRLSHIEGFADRLVDTLSGGERQRAWIAMLVAQNSAFILLDEPTSALDLAHQIDVLRVLHDLSRKRRLGVIAILHDINMAARFCDELIALHSGHVRAKGTPDEIMHGHVLERIYGIPMGVFPNPETGAPIGYAR
jgi:iron complex transport system ATP-binding protein